MYIDSLHDYNLKKDILYHTVFQINDNHQWLINLYLKLTNIQGRTLTIEILEYILNIIEYILIIKD